MEQFINNHLSHDVFVHDIAQSVAKQFIWEEIQHCHEQFLTDIFTTYIQFPMRGVRKFDIGEPKNPIYRTQMFVNPNNKTIVKVFNYPHNTLADFAIIREISYQIRAHEIAVNPNNLQSRSWYVPKIFHFGKLVTGITSPTASVFHSSFQFDTFAFIQMEYIQFSPLKSYIMTTPLLSPQMYDKLAKCINMANDELIKHSLYHNDLHLENILIDPNWTTTNTLKIIIIDYGSAGTIYSSFSDWKYTGEKLAQINPSYTPTTTHLIERQTQCGGISNKKDYNLLTKIFTYLCCCCYNRQ
jgi:serine/threonine protein kinase